MEALTTQALTQAGAFSALGFSAIGSALGCGAAGLAAVGAWKKCYAQGKPAPFQLAVFAGAPLSQTIYGMILMFIVSGKVKAPEGVEDMAAVSIGLWPIFLIMGILAGIAMGASAYFQGRAGAAACDAFAETGEGFTNYLTALGIIETVAIFVMAFAIVLLLGM